MKIETTTGHYGITVTGSVQQDKLEELATLGLAQGVLYRGVFAELRETTGAKRKLEESAPFKADVAEIVKAAIAAAVKPYGDSFTVNVIEYVGGESGGNSRLMATEMWQKVAGTPMEAALGLTGDDITDEQGVEACHKFLAGLRQKPVKK